MERPFLEIRLHRAKPPQLFRCDILHREKNYVVLRYISDCPLKITTCTFKKGSITIAHYWKDRNYVLWEFLEPHAGLKGYLFHICKNVEIGNDYVSYEDLELDIWFDPSGSATVLDEEELNDCALRGLFQSDEVSFIVNQKDWIISNFKSIIHTIWKKGDSQHPHEKNTDRSYSA